MRCSIVLWVLGIGAVMPQTVCAQGDLADLPTFLSGHAAAQHALWNENDKSLRFDTTKRVVMADIKGPATITMIHFALPMAMTLNRDLVLKMYWDGETSPSVDCPMVDFFCDAAGTRAEVNSALVNKRQGWNAYFPMPFRKSARIELVYEGPLAPGPQLWYAMPAYSYVMYRTMDKIPETMGYFHASWRQKVVLLGKEEYVALDAKGKGKFIGWNVTVRRPGYQEYPVDENEKFYVDGEKEAAVEFQGLEDSFGFSWGFPATNSSFPLTGCYPFFKGACAYRFFTRDAIPFEKSLRVTIGFGKHEEPWYFPEYSKPHTRVQFSSTAYWYQTEPHAPFPPLPPAAERGPAPEDRFWPGKEELPTAETARPRGLKLAMFCGCAAKEVVYAEPGYSIGAISGEAFDRWPLPNYHCRASDRPLNSNMDIELLVPAGAEGTVRLLVADPDKPSGGRKQEVFVAGKSLGIVENFQDGRWLQQPLTKQDTATGKILIRAKNLKEGANAVISKIEWVEKK